MILAPHRSTRTNVGTKSEPVCPFCSGREKEEPELYRVGGEKGDASWHVRVIPNKFPFTDPHEIIIHSPDHHKNIEELPLLHNETILQTYRQRYNVHKKHGQVFIFHNRGKEAGESLPHPHTQVTVVPPAIRLHLPPLDLSIYKRPLSLRFWKKKERKDLLETDHFFVFCPPTSDWPDEVWVVPKEKGKTFGEITDKEIADFAFVLARLITIFDLRHANEFPFNYYIYPGDNWYLRLIPRVRVLGAFEIGTHIIVNTQDPAETFAFIRKHFWQPDSEKIKAEAQADYVRSA